MDEQLYQQVLLAVEVSHSPLAAPAERQGAYAFCEAFKDRPDCALYAVAIYKNPTGATANASTAASQLAAHTRQHFALHVLEHYVLTKWSTLPITDQVALRTEVVDLLLRSNDDGALSLSQPSSEPPVFLKEKKVALIAAIAKRQFPQRWPELLPELLAIWHTGRADRIELVLMVLRSLAEDCVSSSFNTSIPPARRKDILQGLNACLPQLCPVVYRELETQYAQYCTAQQTGDTATLRTSAQLIHAALSMLREFMDWLPIDRPLEPSANFVVVAVELLSAHAFRVAAAECLEVYMTRGFGKEHRKLLLETTTLLITKLRSVDLETIARDDLEATVRFHRKVNDVLVAWGTHQFDTIATPGATPLEQALVRAGLETLCRLFSHPSLIVSEAQIVVWLSVLKHRQLVVQPTASDMDAVAFRAELLATLRRVAFAKYFKLSAPDRDDDNDDDDVTGDSIAVRVSADEFDDDHEYMAFFGNFRGRLYALVRSLVQLEPTAALQLLCERTTFVLTQFATGTDHLTRDRGLCTERSTAFLYHEGIAALIDCVVKQLSPQALAQADNAALLHALLERVLAFQTNDPLLKYRQLLILAAFAKFYALAAAQDVLTIVFDVLFYNISFVLPGEDVHGTMSGDTITVRRRALSSLVSICHAIPAHILPVLPVLCTKVQELFAADRVLDAEGVLLYEMLVLVANSMANADERAQFVEQIVAEPLARWTSAELTALVGSPEAIVSAIEASADPAIRKQLFQVIKTLTTLYGIAKRAGAESFERSWRLVLPNLMALLRSLHTLFAPAMRDAIARTQTATWLLALSVDELAQLLGGKHQLDDADSAALPPAAKWAKWHKNVRDVVYHVVGLALSQASFYRLDVASAFFQNNILAAVDCMEHRHLKNALAYVYLPFLKSCPPALYPSLLDPVLTHVLGHIGQRFATCFQPAIDAAQRSSSVSAGGGATTTTTSQWSTFVVGVDDAKRDVAQEKMLLDLVRQVMEFVESAVDAKTVVGVDTDTPKHVMSPADALQRDFMLLQSSALPFVIGSIVVHVIRWKDTLSCRKAALLADKLVTTLFDNAACHALLGRELFAAALDALLFEHAGHVKEDGLKWELINLARNIYCRLVLGLLPVEECRGIDPCNQPRRPDATLCLLPRMQLLALPTVNEAQVDALDVFLREKHSVKTQKNAFKEFLDAPMHAIHQLRASAGSGGGGGSAMDARMLGNRSSSNKEIQDLPEKLVLHAKEAAAAAQLHETHSADLDASALFGL